MTSSIFSSHFYLLFQSTGTYSLFISVNLPQGETEIENEIVCVSMFACVRALLMIQACKTFVLILYAIFRDVLWFE